MTAKYTPLPPHTIAWERRFSDFGFMISCQVWVRQYAVSISCLELRFLRKRYVMMLQMISLRRVLQGTCRHVDTDWRMVSTIEGFELRDILLRLLVLIYPDVTLVVISHVHSLAFATYNERMNVIDFYNLLLLRLLLQFTGQVDGCVRVLPSRTIPYLIPRQQANRARTLETWVTRT